MRAGASHRTIALLSGVALTLAACGGGGSSSSPTSGTATVTPSPTPTPATGGSFTVPAAEALTVTDVQRIIAQAAEEASARSLPATIAVVDRVGNVLAVYRQTGARTTFSIPATASNSDLQGLTGLPAEAAAIAKAVTGAYLSSSGNAFSTRTASMIVQEHFPPSAGTRGLESGPLFGVQFSQLPCSDVNTRAAAGAIGPKRSPLGLSADPGGLPLYKNGVVVGGIGIMADGVYGFDPEVTDVDTDAEELIAIAGSTGFEAPESVRADRIAADGTTLRFTDRDATALRTTPSSARAFSAVAGALLPVTGYFTGAIAAGSSYGSEASGVRRATAAEFGNSDAFVLSDGSGNNRFPIRAGQDAAEAGTPLTAAEVRAVLEEAFTVMTRARAQIRRPLDSRAQVSLTVVDSRGNILGLVRSPDAPIFGIDVSAQKARTAAFFSNAAAASDLLAAPDATTRAFVAAMRTFTGRTDILGGAIAFSNRAVGNLARPYFPDGELGRANGPLSVGIANFSPFGNGLQSNLITANVVTHVTHVATGGASADVGVGCTALPSATGTAGQSRIRNGIQIFPGAVPIYRGTRLVGAIGISGDGIDQDDMIAFLGGSVNGTARAGGGLNPAAAGIRSDNVVIDVAGRGVRLRWVGCPFAPFLDTTDQNACEGK
ncbi:MAG: heme-binding protein [Alphaproteobacteria bacterium]|nr:heme-binding protein [Alphaproteobacteria bacterium]